MGPNALHMPYTRSQPARLEFSSTLSQ